jgi:hypothetical protein
VVNSTNIYPIDLDESIYDNGEIWSAVLFAMNGDLGRGVADSLIIQTHYSYAQNIAMSDAAILLIDADSILFNGTHFCDIYERLLEHGFITTTPNEGCTAISGIINTEPNNFRFAQNGNSFTLYNNAGAKISLQILSITGQQVLPSQETQEIVFNYRNSTIASGVYLVNILTSNGPLTFKWMNMQGR